MTTPTPTTANPFNPATKGNSYLRLAIQGPEGSGKTRTALEIATAIGPRIALRDSERGSAEKFSDLYKFDVDNAESHNVKSYIRSIAMASWFGYDVLILDSISHEWAGTEGILETVDKLKASGEKHLQPWATATPLHNMFLTAINEAPIHIIATMRTKTEWVLEQAQGGLKPRKVGMAPIQRDGIGYEFDIVGELDLEHRLRVTKSRCPELDGYTSDGHPGAKEAKIMIQWLGGHRPVDIAWHDEEFEVAPGTKITWQTAVFGDPTAKPPANQPTKFGSGSARWLQLQQCRDKATDPVAIRRLNAVMQMIRWLNG